MAFATLPLVKVHISSTLPLHTFVLIQRSNSKKASAFGPTMPTATPSLINVTTFGTLQPSG